MNFLKKNMKFIIYAILLTVIAGCASLHKNSDDDIKRCIKLADSIELNGSRLVVTNGQLLIVFPADRH